MERYLCHICGTLYEGDVCPACGTPRALSEPPTELTEDASAVEQKAGAGVTTRYRLRARPGAEPLRFGGRGVTKALRHCLWGMLLFAFCVSVLFARRNLPDLEAFIGNLVRFVQNRSEVVCLWEEPEAVGRLSSVNNLLENLPRFAELAGDHFFDAIEEVGGIWSTH